MSYQYSYPYPSPCSCFLVYKPFAIKSIVFLAFFVIKIVIYDMMIKQLGFSILTGIFSFVMSLQEVWTLCKILKRDVSYKKWQEISSKPSLTDSSCTTSCSSESNMDRDRYLNFGASAAMENERKHFSDIYERNQFSAGQLSLTGEIPYMASCVSDLNPNGDDYSKEGNWDELMPMAEFVTDPSMLYSFRQIQKINVSS